MITMPLDKSVSVIPEPRDGLAFLKRIRTIETVGECRIVNVSDLLDLLCTCEDSFVLLECESLISKHSQDWKMDDPSLCLELITRLERADQVFQREMIYRALIRVMERKPRTDRKIADMIGRECSKDIEHPEANAPQIQLPFGAKLPASGSSIVARLAGEVLAGYCDLVNASSDSLSRETEMHSRKAFIPLAAQPLDPDQTRQVENLREIMSTARFSPCFKRNPKYPGLERPRISYGDVMGNRLIIRDDFSDGFNRYWDDSEAPLVKKYDSEEELAQDGWRLD
jgi:hypothetical protein